MHGLLIGGRRTAGHGRIEVTEPARGETFAEVAAASTDDLDAAVTAARAALPGWAGMTPVARAEILFRFADLVRARGEELAVLEARNVGKPIGDARWEAGHVADTLRYYADTAFVVGDPLTDATQMGPVISTGQRARTEDYLAAGKADGARLLCGGERRLFGGVSRHTGIHE